MINLHILTRSKKVEIPSDLIFFDSESYVDIDLSKEEIQKTLNNETVKKEHETYLISSCFCRKNRSGDYSEKWKDYHTELTFEQKFWKDVDNFTQKKRKTLVIAHNAKYDVLATGAIPSLIKEGYRVTGFSDDNPFFLNLEKNLCPVCGNHEIEEDNYNYICYDCLISFHSKYTDRKKILILSSTNYYQFPLAKLGECFKIPKLEIDYNVKDINASVTYCRRDVEILKVAILQFIKFIQDEKLGSFKYTIAGQSFNAYRHRFLPDDIYIHRQKEALLVERQAYAGGRNEVWKIGHHTEKLYYVDVNSMYPYVMKFKEYPSKLLTYRSRCTTSELKSFIDRGFLVCARVELDTVSRIYFKKEERLIFPAGNFETFLSTPEITRALEDNEIKKVKELCVYEKSFLFNDYVNYFYNMRLKAKENKDEVRTLLYKLFLNSLYGKFGQKNNNWEKIGTADPEVVSLDQVFNYDTKKRDTIKTFGGGVFKRVDLPDGENEAYNSFPAIASHVTAYARMLLWNYIETAGIDNVYYMDTDSLFLNEEGYKNLEKSGALDDKELGKMKLENIIHYAEFRGCKDYTLKYQKDGQEHEEIKIKGVNKKSTKINDNKYVSIVWRGFSKYLRNGKLDNYSNDIIIKDLKREYTKGIINNKSQVEPFIYVNDKNIIKEDRKKDIEELKGKISYLKSIEENNYLKDIIKELGGIKPEGNGAYKEELKHLKYPIRNFKSGMEIDRVTTIVNFRLGTDYNNNELIETLLLKSNLGTELNKLKQQLKELLNKAEFKETF
jgi:hypothetical protein